MKNKIIIVHKGQFDQFPPLISVKSVLNNLGYSVDVLTTGASNKKMFLDDEELIVVSRNKIPIIGFLLWYFKFLFKYRKTIKRDYKYVWIEGGDTLSLFGLFFKVKPKSKFIMQISELYDVLPIYKFFIGLSIKKFSKVVMPEINRAYIFKVWYKLKKLPYVLPNKPNYQISDSKLLLDSDSSSKISKIQNFANNRKIILYQGIIARDRKFPAIIDFVLKHDDYCLVILGRDLGYLTEINIDKNNIYYAGFLNPPAHLEVTKHAYICLMAYDTTSLNKVYCAPNKIWEYTQFSKPILSQQLPGIESIFLKYKFGECCNFNEYSDVENSILKIESNYSVYSTNALIFYEGFDFEKAVKNILS